jgi:hypothetical protein
MGHLDFAEVVKSYQDGSWSMPVGAYIRMTPVVTHEWAVIYEMHCQSRPAQDDL